MLERAQCWKEHSAGKSTVLHALLYLGEILQNRNFNPTTSLLSTKTLSLGGFSTLLNNWDEGPDCNGIVSLSVRFRLNEHVLDEHLMLDLREAGMDDRILNNDTDDDLGCVGSMYNARSQIRNAEVKIEISKNDEDVVCCHGFGLRFNDHDFLTLNRVEDGPASGQINLSHELLQALQLFHVNTDIVAEIRLKSVQARLSDLEAFQPHGSNELLHCVFVHYFADKEFSIESWRMSGIDAIFRAACGLEHVGKPEPPVYILPGFEFRNIVASAFGNQDSTSDERNDCFDDGVVFECDKAGTFRPSFVVTRHSPEYAVELAQIYHKSMSMSPSPPFISGPCEFSWKQAKSPLPDLRAPIKFDWDGPEYSKSVSEQLQAIEPSFKFTWEDWYNEYNQNTAEDSSEFDALAASVFIDHLVRGSLTVLQKHLATACYVGPKRSTVPRELTSRNADALTDWGDGLAAWKWLLSSKTTVQNIELCSRWLSGEQFLNTDYRLERKFFREVPEELLKVLSSHGDAAGKEKALTQLSEIPKMWRIMLLDEHLNPRHPQDLGEGITQVVPVLAALAAEFEIVAFEQPELHLHPSLSARLGDVLLQLIVQERLALVETHSEHLILRLLRRIRQTTDNELPDHIPPVQPDDVCVLYVDNLGDGTTIKRLRIDEHGEFIDRWPHGFFSERAEELF